MPKAFPWSAATAIARLQDVQTRIKTNAPGTQHVYTHLFDEPAADLPDTALAGALVSIKDLLDVKGHVTHAGTTFMGDNAPATKDADVVAALRAQGCVLVGHTNMTELAYSGLGLNPHYGTPENALYPGCIPGGSTSGGAVSVAQGLADVAIGTDTGGSLRIPAAFNGITGFKPSQSSVSQTGCRPLSRSLDSIGPMARDVATCRAVWQAIATEQADTLAIRPEFVIPENFGMDDLDPAVRAGFDAAVALLREAGFTVSTHSFAALEAMKSLAVWQFSSVESRAEYEDAFQTRFDSLDPRVASRMARADEATAVSYRQTLNLRNDLIAAFDAELDGRALLMPTVPILPPRFDAVQDDADFGRINLQALRNPTIANVMNGCSISLPFAHASDTIGVMLIASGHSDPALLDLAERCETLFQADAVEKLVGDLLLGGTA
ncbi:amidase family protein [Salipiger sp. 1_MG-2023]|uniref:amidase family protein n=1 Tax=Salipiger sp. 1_MG-2023 TaxID=3062665 RepID=UPI0026E3B82C|nr:amidase family protein [Salipiger sp. 1_MG-2023]MDO6588347.1 amidase family protein [Salipiger sp. 1_MG-2023]